jgi:molybdopterin-synthase adenylyltransferase
VLRACHVIIGCVDSYRERDELERFARRFLIAYIDIGMDVHPLDNGLVVGGQVVLSSPGHLCLRCMGIITDARIAEEARPYGAAGGRPQVVWPNGVLASTAIGLLVQLVTPWHPDPVGTAYLEYDGNRHTVQPSNLLALAGRTCRHYPAGEVGDPFLGDA